MSSAGVDPVVALRLKNVNSGEVEVLKVDTKEQRADYLTKGLSREQYKTIRKLVQGW